MYQFALNAKTWLTPFSDVATQANEAYSVRHLGNNVVSCNCGN